MEEQKDEQLENIETKIDEAHAAAEAQKALAEAAEKFQVERMEKVVITAREKLLPLLKEKNKTVEESKRLMETLSVTINQGLFLLMKSTTVGQLELKGKINENYTGFADFIQLIDLLEQETMEDAIESLQWMAKKIDATLAAENKERMFDALDIDF